MGLRNNLERAPTVQDDELTANIFPLLLANFTPLDLVQPTAGAAKMSHRPSNLSLQVEAQTLLTTVAGQFSMVFGGRD